MTIDATRPRVFGILLEEPYPEVIDAITSRYKAYKASPTFYLVASADLAQTIATTIGIRPPEGADLHAAKTGVVFRLNGVYSGYFDRSIWEWLGNYE
ncbi:MAG: hypothetical protein OXG65_00675 [Chloroflexi bacterium]|nr:hypothetical protein [Chloroflexota bacterium]